LDCGLVASIQNGPLEPPMTHALLHSLEEGKHDEIRREVGTLNSLHQS
jgi:hypothetical protein